MDGDRHEAPHTTDVLIRKVDSHLTAVRAGLRGADLVLAERVAAVLRELVVDTTQACAADRARVRAAVHFFVLRREGRGSLLPVRSLAAAHQMVNKVAVRLGRPDLMVTADPKPPQGVPGVPGKGNSGDDASLPARPVGVPTG
jgi:hypothetical protein